MLIEEFYSGRLAPRLGPLPSPPYPTPPPHPPSSPVLFPVSGRRTTGSALCGGISMGLHKPKESLGQRRVLQRYKNASLARSLSGLDNTWVEAA